MAIGDRTTPEIAAVMARMQGEAPLVGALKLGRETARRQVIGQEEIRQARATLQRYKEGKASLEEQIKQDEQWYKLRHWSVIRGKVRPDAVEPTSAWLFNAIAAKHADAMDNYPEPVVLPREESDEASAKVLSSVLPVVMEEARLEEAYNYNWWEKLKHGCGVYGVTWDKSLCNGMGDISIKPIDLLNLFWEPGIADIQRSRNLFVVDLVDTDLLEEEYPQYAGKFRGGGEAIVAKYQYDDTVDTSNKTEVVDWYYKRRTPTGRTVLHYVKFAGDAVLFASENEEGCEDGWYHHGLYPVVPDNLFPVKGSPVGFGYVALCRDPQMYIDKLSGEILENAVLTNKVRFFVSESTAVNVDEFADFSKQIVKVNGEISDARIKQIIVQPMGTLPLEVMRHKIDEMKETASNRDVTNGSSGSGVTAAAAISALQEAGNKMSRDMIAASYRAQVNISSMCIELMAQFYDEERSFRIIGPSGAYEFIQMSNAGIKDQFLGYDSAGEAMYRKPVFDLKIKAQKRNPFSRLEQNLQAKELYAAGFFNPERAQEAMVALEMMDFEGIDKVKERVEQGQTMLNVVQQMAARMDQMAALLQAVTGQDMGLGQPPAPGRQGGGRPAGNTGSGTVAAGLAKSRENNLTGYGQRIVERAGPNMEQAGGVAQ